jgi:hypothetical protein
LVRRKRSRRSRELVGGHFVSALVGFAVLKLTGPQAWAAAVGLSILAMYVTGTFHPQAGINPLLVVSGNLPWTFLFAPVLAGGVLLTAFAWLWHRWVRGQKWPQRWLRPAQGFDASHRSHPAGRRAADGGRKHSQFHVECHVDLRVPRLNSCRSNGHEPSNKVELASKQESRLSALIPL